MRPQVGQLFQNKYRLLRLIGDGGMGSVYEARHELLGTTVALKFLHPELGRRQGLVQRFLQEARVSAQIQSPHVVRVIDVDQSAEGLAYIVLEYLEGGTLQGLYEDLYKAGQRLAFPDALNYAMQILEGVEAAHRTGVVHRDLKPDNVMITRDAKGAPLVKLLDFGIAKLKVTGQLERGLTRPGVIMGTPEYMAPEQAYSADAVDARADIFSLGVMIFEMLAGRRPVGGDEPQQIAGAYLSGNIAKLSELVPGVAPELAAAIHKAMAPLAKDRFDSVAELRAALEPFAPRPSLSSGAGISSPAVTPAFSSAPAAPSTNVGEGNVGEGGRGSSVPKTIPPEETHDASAAVASALAASAGASMPAGLVSALPSSTPNAGSFGPPGTPGAFIGPAGPDAGPHAGMAGGVSGIPAGPHATDLSGGPLPQSMRLPGTTEAAPLGAGGTALGASALPGSMGPGGTAFGGDFAPPGPGMTQGTAPMDPYASTSGLANASYPSPVARPRKKSRAGALLGTLALASAVAGITVGAVWGIQRYRTATATNDEPEVPVIAPTVVSGTPAETAASPVTTPPPVVTTPPPPVVTTPPPRPPPVATAKPPATSTAPKPPPAGTVIMLPTALPTLPGIGQIPVPPWGPQQPPQQQPPKQQPQPQPSGTTPKRPYVPILPGGGGRREAPERGGSPGDGTNDKTDERPRIPRPMLGLPVERSKKVRPGAEEAERAPRRTIVLPRDRRDLPRER